MKHIIFVLLLLFASTVDSANLGVTLGSKHLVTEGDNSYVEFNPGIIYYGDQFIVGAYTNSYGDTAFGVGKRFPRKLFGANVDLDLGLVFYPAHDSKSDGILPLVQGTVDVARLGMVDVGRFRIGYSPMINDEMIGLVPFQFIIPLD